MGRIKSAWEIALEKTQDIKVDPEKLKRDELLTLSRKLAGSFLIDYSMTDEAFLKALDDMENKALASRTILETVVANLSLPSNEYYTDRLQRLGQMMNLASPQNEEAQEAFSQLEGLFAQYIVAKADLLKRLKDQYQQMAKQKGTYPDNDPEFVKLCDTYIDKLQSQFSEALEQMKSALSQALGL